jgi:hypothetical protein
VELCSTPFKFLADAFTGKALYGGRKMEVAQILKAAAQTNEINRRQSFPAEEILYLALCPRIFFVHPK